MEKYEGSVEKRHVKLDFDQPALTEYITITQRTGTEKDFWISGVKIFVEGYTEGEQNMFTFYLLTLFSYNFSYKKGLFWSLKSGVTALLFDTKITTKYFLCRKTAKYSSNHKKPVPFATFQASCNYLETFGEILWIFLPILR